MRAGPQRSSCSATASRRFWATLRSGSRHVGSTAVPGLEAKPIVDIDVVIRHADDFAGVAARLATLGYVHLGDLGIVGREAFRAAPDLPRHHLFVCASGAAALQAHLILRDTLRSDAELSAAYGALQAAAWANGSAMTGDRTPKRKTAFITSILLDAREVAAAGNGAASGEPGGGGAPAEKGAPSRSQ